MILYLAGNPGGIGRIDHIVRAAPDRLLTFFEMDRSPGYKGTLDEFKRRSAIIRKRISTKKGG